MENLDSELGEVAGVISGEAKYTESPWTRSQSSKLPLALRGARTTGWTLRGVAEGVANYFSKAADPKRQRHHFVRETGRHVRSELRDQFQGQTTEL